MMSEKNDNLLESYKRKILKSLDHLDYSLKKAQALSPGPSLSEEQLETWESFAARLSRSVDLFLTKYLRLRIKREDPGFDGSLRDYCNLAEKLGLIDNAEAWMTLRSFLLVDRKNDLSKEMVMRAELEAEGNSPISRSSAPR
jgi:hypothetical protein